MGTSPGQGGGSFDFGSERWRLAGTRDSVRQITIQKHQYHETDTQRQGMLYSVRLQLAQTRPARNMGWTIRLCPCQMDRFGPECDGRRLMVRSQGTSSEQRLLSDTRHAYLHLSLPCVNWLIAGRESSVRRADRLERERDSTHT